MTEKHSPLLPCPFCGELPENDQNTYVHCANAECPACVETYGPKAVASWNTRAAASAEPVAWWCVNYPGGGGALTPFEDVVSHWRSQGLDVEPLYTHPAPDAQPDAEIVAALEVAAKQLADIREFCTDHKKRPCGDPDAECPISMGEWFSREDLAELDRIDAALTKAKGDSAPTQTIEDRYDGAHAFPDEN